MGKRDFLYYIYSGCPDTRAEIEAATEVAEAEIVEVGAVAVDTGEVEVGTEVEVVVEVMAAEVVGMEPGVEEV